MFCASRLLDAGRASTDECKAVEVAIVHLVWDLADKLKRTVSDGLSNVDILRKPLLADGQRKRRIDEAFRNAGVDGSVEDKQAKSGRQFLRCYKDTVDPKICASWEKRSLEGYIVSQRRGLRALTGTSHSVEDGVRVGDPA